MKEKWKVVINAPVVIGFTAICFAATLSGLLTGGYSTRLLFQTMHTPLKNVMTWLRFFTHVFGHAGWAHFFGNAAYLLLLGPLLEEKYGPRTLAAIIAVTAFATALVSYILFWNIGICGASGVVFAFILLASFTGFKEGEIPLTFILTAVIYIGQQIFEGITVSDNISNMSHIVGGLTGAAMGYILNRKDFGSEAGK